MELLIQENNVILQEADASKEEMKEYALQQIQHKHAHATQLYANIAATETAILTRTRKAVIKTV